MQKKLKLVPMSQKPTNHDPKPLRKVRSFVKRTGRLSESQREALETLWPKWGLEAQASSYDWQAVFGRQAEVVLDIGFGMGHSLLALAESHPHQNFVGIEVHESGVANVLKGIEEKQLSNIRLFQGDAVDLLQQCFADHCLAKVLLFFPDPWHKKRHHKRRLVQQDFIALLEQKLIDQGVFHVATDWQAYAQHVLEMMAECPGFVNQVPSGGYNQRPPQRPLTKYEQRGLKLGHQIWDLIFQKVVKDSHL